MEYIQLSYPASRQLTERALAGVVGSGDLEVLFEPHQEQQLRVKIKTSVDGSQQRWLHLFERLSQQLSLPKGLLEINDSGATPGVIRLRIEQAFEDAGYVD